MGTAAPFRGRVEVAPRLPDRRLDVLPMDLGRLEDPGLLAGIGQKAAEFGAPLAFATDCARPPPIARRLQRFRGTGAQMLDTCEAQSLDAHEPLTPAEPISVRSAGTSMESKP
jgi:hypothetical protein